ncbi:hypothetical protein KQX54_021239 [Cotesia glomerata]|uniref:Uncharacterized protein n=1 Tax=Cotesia glomerata TaxID=32391 RepID=A0AAV7J6E8_COTGL|nr:hypothetical protein KQX54_021239 [Cotesia glomerata]
MRRAEGDMRASKLARELDVEPELAPWFLQQPVILSHPDAACLPGLSCLASPANLLLATTLYIIHIDPSTVMSGTRYKAAPLLLTL